MKLKIDVFTVMMLVVTPVSLFSQLTTLWEARYGRSHYPDQIRSTCVMANDNIVLAGYSQVPPDNQMNQLWVKVITPLGDSIADKHYTIEVSQVVSIKAYGEDNAIAVIHLDSFPDDMVSGHCVALLNELGDTLSTQCFYDSVLTYYSDIIEVPDGYVLYGYQKKSDRDCQTVIGKYLFTEMQYDKRLFGDTLSDLGSSTGQKLIKLSDDRLIGFGHSDVNFGPFAEGNLNCVEYNSHLDTVSIVTMRNVVKIVSVVKERDDFLVVGGTIGKAYFMKFGSDGTIKDELKLNAFYQARIGNYLNGLGFLVARDSNIVAVSPSFDSLWEYQGGSGRIESILPVSDNSFLVASNVKGDDGYFDARVVLYALSPLSTLPVNSQRIIAGGQEVKRNKLYNLLGQQVPDKIQSFKGVLLSGKRNVSVK